MPAKALPTFPQADVARHNNKDSCFVTIGTYVYDVTDFLDIHPGGAERILEYASKDIGDIMRDEDSHTHSEAAYRMLRKKHIGYVATPHVLETAVKSDDPASIVPLPPSQTGMKILRANGAATHVAGKVVQQQTGYREVDDPNLAFMQTTEPGGRKDFLDLDKPMLMQIWNGGFSKEEYLEQVHRPAYYIKDGKPASAPLFGNFLEPLSLTPWWVIPITWYPCEAVGLYWAYSGLSSGVETAAYWLLGLAIWTLIEYGMHRGLFHVDKYLPDNRVGLTAHFLLHGIHHYLPMDKQRLVMPPALLVFLAVPYWHLAHTVFSWDWYVATAVFCGGFFGYIGYDLTHYFLHHKTLPKYYQQLKSYHMAHHYGDFENGFGVTNRFWDKVFGTELIMPAKAAKAA